MINTHLVASCTSRSEGFFVAVVTVNVIIFWHKLLGTDVFVANLADKTFVMPLFALVTQSFGTYPEQQQTER